MKNKKIIITIAIIFNIINCYSQTNSIDTYAVIVGVAKYNTTNSLQYTKDDAYRFWGHLLSENGGNVSKKNIKLLLNDEATKYNIIRALNEFSQKADENDRLIFYFSGHGSKGAFIPYDKKGYIEYLYHTKISSIFKKSKAKYKIIIADACFSGTMNRDKKIRKDDIENFYQALNDSKKSYVLFMSSSSQETSIETDNVKQGIFTFYLIKGLEGLANTNNDNIVTITELYNYVADNVKKYTANRQNPVIYGKYDKDLPMSFVSPNNNYNTYYTDNLTISSPYNSNDNYTKTGKLSIAFNNINEYTEVYIDNKFIDKVKYTFSVHPGCFNNKTITKKLKVGKHNLKVKTLSKTLLSKDIIIKANHCEKIFIKIEKPICTTSNTENSIINNYYDDSNNNNTDSFSNYYNDNSNNKKDTDHDGVPDNKDFCPLVYGSIYNHGCPVIKIIPTLNTSIMYGNLNNINVNDQFLAAEIGSFKNHLNEQIGLGLYMNIPDINNSVSVFNPYIVFNAIAFKSLKFDHQIINSLHGIIFVFGSNPELGFRLFTDNSRSFYLDASIGYFIPYYKKIKYWSDKDNINTYWYKIDKEQIDTNGFSFSFGFGYSNGFGALQLEYNYDIAPFFKPEKISGITSTYIGVFKLTFIQYID